VFRGTLLRWSDEGSIINRPETGYDAEEGTLAAAVWSGDEKMIARFYLQIRVVNKDTDVYNKIIHSK